MYILVANEFVMVCGHKTLERMTNEHELEVFVKSSLLGNGRQIAEYVQVGAESNVRVRIEIVRGAVSSC